MEICNEPPSSSPPERLPDQSPDLVKFSELLAIDQVNVDESPRDTLVGLAHNVTFGGIGNITLDFS